MLLRTLGGLTLEGASFGRPKPLLLLAYLALEGPTERRYLSDVFWLGAANARGSLATALSQLRGGLPGVIGTDGVRVSGEVESDATRFLAAVDGRDWLRVAELYRGPFLEGVDVSGESVELEEWLYGTRELLARSARTALLTLGEGFAEQGRFEEASTWAERARKVDRTVLPGPHELVRLYTLLLATESPHAAVLREEATAVEVDLPVTIEEARESYDSPVGAPTGQSLPSRTTPFIGRRRELEQLTSMLSEPSSRLLSVIGAGGSGKTRLGLHFATAQAETVTWESVDFVALAGLRDAGQVIPAIADALELRMQDDNDAVTELCKAIGSSLRLMVLDNFEHLLPAAPLLSELVRACPGLRLVITSRERLSLDAERVLVLEGLDIPSAKIVSLDDALRYDAVSLFVARARRVRSDFVLDREALQAVVRICELVGGMPLALEMAAAWVRVMGCEEIADELGEGLHLLESPAGDRPDRHQSVRVVFEHSWLLLTPGEQQVMRDLSVFRDGFQRPAAARVAGASLSMLARLIDRSLIHWDGAGRYDLHPLLHQYLIDKAQQSAEGGDEARVRHARYFLAKAGALQDAFPTGNARNAAAEIGVDFANIFAAWECAVRHELHDLLTDAVNPIGWFFSIQGLLEQGLAWSNIDTNPKPISLLAVRQFQWQAVFLNLVGRLEEAMTRNGRAIHIAERIGRDAERDLAGALRLRAGMQRRIEPCDDMAAAATYRRAFTLYEELGNAGGAAVMLNSLAQLAGTPIEAQKLMRESLRLARDSGNVHAIGRTLNSMALHYRCRSGEYVAARAAAEESLASHEASGFRLQIGTALLNFGEVLVATGDIGGVKAIVERMFGHCNALQAGTEAALRAQAHILLGHAERIGGEDELAVGNYREALGLLDSAGGLESAVKASSSSLNGLGRIALMRSQPQAAVSYANQVLGLLPSREMLARVFLSGGRLRCLVQLGEALTIEHEHQEAEEQLHEALRLASEAELIPMTLETLLGLAVLRQQQEIEEVAVQLLAFVAAHPASTFELRQRAAALLERPEPKVAIPAAERPRLRDMVALAMRDGPL